VPEYGRARFEHVRARMRQLWPERWDTSGSPLHPYRLAAQRNARGARFLDVASGLGAGTAHLAERGSALGVDREAAAVHHARERFGQRARFEVGDALELELAPGSVDCLVSVHTLEHLADDRGFLERAERWLARAGELVLEVPLLMRRPFVAVERPLSPDHEREYDLPGLRALVGERFDVQALQGVARGAYVEPARARNAALIVARKRQAA
jgi:SAM-dependent methyltransferase